MAAVTVLTTARVSGVVHAAHTKTKKFGWPLHVHVHAQPLSAKHAQRRSQFSMNF